MSFHYISLTFCFLTPQMKVTIHKVTQTRGAESSSPYGSTSTPLLDIICSCIRIILCSLYSILAYVPALENFQFCTELQSGFVLHYPPTTLVLYSDCLKMQPNPIIVALAKILHQFLKDIWTPLKTSDANDTLLQNAVAPLLSSDTSVRSSLSHGLSSMPTCTLSAVEHTFPSQPAKLPCEPLGIEW